MNKFLLIILAMNLSINLTAEQEENKQHFLSFNRMPDDASADKHQDDDYKSLSELSKFEQLVHKSLMSKFDLLI